MGVRYFYLIEITNPLSQILQSVLLFPNKIAASSLSLNLISPLLNAR